MYERFEEYIWDNQISTRVWLNQLNDQIRPLWPPVYQSKSQSGMLHIMWPLWLQGHKLLSHLEMLWVTTHSQLVASLGAGVLPLYREAVCVLYFNDNYDDKYSFESKVLPYFNNVWHNLSALNAFATAGTVTNHAKLWDVKLICYSSNATCWIWLQGLESGLRIHCFWPTWLCLIVDVLATWVKFF